MAYAHVAHDCMIGNKIVFANCAMLAGHVEDRRLGDPRRAHRRAPVQQDRRARLSRRRRHRAARRAPVRHGRRATPPCRTRSMPRASSVAASTPSRSATSARPTASSIARDLRLAEALVQPRAAGGRRSPRSRLFVDFIHASDAQPGAMNAAGVPLSRAGALRVGIVAGEHSGDQLGRGADRRAARTRTGARAASASRDRRWRGRLRGLGARR